MALRPEDTLKLRIRPRQLALLVALDAQRNLRRAAAAVSISQPAATKLLAQLEADLGLPLFERSARGMAPTAYGATMIRHAQVVRSDFRHAHEELEALASGRHGVLRVACVASAVPDLLAPVLERFKRDWPLVRIGVTVDTSDVVMPQLARGDIDVALARLPDRPLPEDIDAELLRRDRQVIACGIDDPLARRRRLALRHLAGRTWVLQPRGSPQRERMESALREAGGDSKLLAVPIDKCLPWYKHWQKPEDLAPERIAQIQHFFEHYKDLEKGKWVKVRGWAGADAARQEILAGVEAYKSASPKPAF